MHNGVAEMVAIVLGGLAIVFLVIGILMIVIPLIVGIVPGLIFIMIFSIKSFKRKDAENGEKRTIKFKDIWELIVGVALLLFGLLLYLLNFILFIKFLTS